MKDQTDRTPHQMAESPREAARPSAPIRQPLTARYERMLAFRPADLADEPAVDAELHISRYSSEYGPYAGVRVACPACGHPIGWTLEEDVFSDLPTPIGFCSACHTFIGARA